jgi:uncharacterized protein (TIGR02271 family)
MFDSRSEAEAARDQLRSTTGADARIVDQSSSSTEGSSDGRGFWASMKDVFVADEDRSGYEEGVRRGGFLLCANVDESQADEACRLLETGGSVNFENRQKQWRDEGWNGQQSTERTMQRENTVEEEHIPIVEEQLSVGKREVSRGGAHVRSYVRETPVSEQVNLREENISIERRPVNETISSADLNRGDLLQDRDIEVRATGEEAVVSKEAHVTDEVVVRKTENNRTENVQDTVRHTEVDVEEGAERSAMGFDRDDKRRETLRTRDVENERR